MIPLVILSTVIFGMLFFALVKIARNEDRKLREMIREANKTKRRSR